MHQPLVSILINNYNYADFLSEAIDSALNQTYPYTEVIVVDDASVDNSQKIMDGYGDSIISIFNKQNKGQAAAFNEGVKVSKGEIICLLDADDLFFPDKVSQVVRLFESRSNCNWFFHESVPIRSQDIARQKSRVISDEDLAKDISELVEYVDFRNEVLNGKMPKFMPSTSNLCFSKDVAQKIFPLPEIKGFSRVAISDAYLKFSLVALGTGYGTKSNFGIFRLHNNNRFTAQKLKKRRKVNAEISLVTARQMQLNLPSSSRLSNKLFARGLSLYLRIKDNDLDYGRLIKEYIFSADVKSKVQILLMTAYYSVMINFGKIR